MSILPVENFCLYSCIYLFISNLSCADTLSGHFYMLSSHRRVSARKIAGLISAYFISELLGGHFVRTTRTDSAKGKSGHFPPSLEGECPSAPASERFKRSRFSGEPIDLADVWSTGNSGNKSRDFGAGVGAEPGALLSNRSVSQPGCSVPSESQWRPAGAGQNENAALTRKALK